MSEQLPGETMVEWADRVRPAEMARARAELHLEAHGCDCGDWRTCETTTRKRRVRR